MNRFKETLRFLTRIPVKTSGKFDSEFHKNMYFFPATGFVIGIIIYLISMAMIFVFPENAFLISTVAVMAETIITGGLHLDGLGDTADALFSYRDRERMLEIMKDSRLGTNAMLAVLFNVLIKISLISYLINIGAIPMIILMPAVSRLSVLALTYKTESPREAGMGNTFIGKCTLRMILTDFIYTMIISLILLLVFYRNNSQIAFILIITFVVSVIINAIFNIILKKRVYKKIGGITGDILGCGIELSENIFIISVLLILRVFI